jgi:hypothetical protein
MLVIYRILKEPPTAIDSTVTTLEGFPHFGLHRIFVLVLCNFKLLCMESCSFKTAAHQSTVDKPDQQ